MSTTEAHAEPPRPSPPMSMDALARAQGVRPVRSLDDLALDVWTSDAELDAFLADVRRARQSDLG
ncbi:MAG TPA: hypothetical protein VNQ77_14160 [Frankiaceae bacterium]|nr:hypothetical protein [Frankiaceae bacterium]